MAASMFKGKMKHQKVDLDINPASRQDLQNVMEMGGLNDLVMAGARICEAGCLGCIGMGQAPGSGAVSVRTFPRNFKGRSGTVDARCTSLPPKPRLPVPYRQRSPILAHSVTLQRCLIQSGSPSTPSGSRDPAPESATVGKFSGDPTSNPSPSSANWKILEGPVLLKVEDNITTDHIMPAGTRVLPFRSNIPKISEFVFDVVDPTLPNGPRKPKRVLSSAGDSDRVPPGSMPR